MSLEFDPETGKIMYHGREVGEHRCENGKSTVRISVEYVTMSDDCIDPLVLFSLGLSRLPENLPSKPIFSIEAPEDSIEFQL